MSDRVVVMSQGEIRQVGTPENVYFKPVDTFVANFVGEVNLLKIREHRVEGSYLSVQPVTGSRFTATVDETLLSRTPEMAAADLRVVVRPEHVAIGRGAALGGKTQLVSHGIVVDSVFLGDRRSVTVETEEGWKVMAIARGDDNGPFEGESVSFGWSSADALVTRYFHD